MANETNATNYESHSYYLEWNYRYHVIAGVLTTSVVVIGVVANLVALVVLLRGEMRRGAAAPTNLYLVAITALDTIILVKAGAMWSLPAVDHYRDLLESYRMQVLPYIVRGLYPIAIASFTAARWLMVVLAADRYLSLCRPHSARSWCTMRAAAALLIVTGGVALLFNMPRFFEIELHMWRRPNTNETYASVFTTELWSDPVYRGMYTMGMFVPLVMLAPLVAMCALTGLTCRRLASIWREYRSSSARSAGEFLRGSEEQLNLSLVGAAMVVVYVACHLLDTILTLEYVWRGSRRLLTMEHHTALLVGELLSIINSAANLLIYLVFYNKFRTIFLKLCCSRFVKAPDSLLLPVAYHADSPSPLGSNEHFNKF